MKKISFKMLGCSILMAAAVAATSCKDREKDATDTNSADEINGEIYGKGTPSDAEGQGSTMQDTTSGTGVETDSNSGSNGAGTTGSRSGASGSTSGSGSTTGSGSGSAGSSGTTASRSSTGYGDSNDPLENSSSPAVTRNGQAVQSGGSSGSGMGTGTGSTGNNSRVSKKSDQLRD